MSALYLAQWRLVRTSTLVFTALGIAIPPLMDGAGVTNTVSPQHVSLFVTWLGASLAARLFSSDLLHHDTAWWRSLPIERESWLRLKAGLGLSVLTASFVVQWASWHSPLYDMLFEITRRELHQLATTPLWAVPTFALALLTFAVTAYFATSFERRASAVQAGLPGYFSALALFTLVADDELVLHPLRAWTLVLVPTVAGLWIARSLWRRRAAVPTQPDERVLGRGNAFDVGLHVAGQALFVALPLWLAAIQNDFSGRFLGPVATGVVLLLIGGVACLPWTIRESRSFGVRTRRGLSALVLRTSGLGIPLWKALRNGHAILACGACGRVRDSRERACTGCGSFAVTDAAPKGFARRLPSTPWSVFFVVIIPYTVLISMVKMFAPTTHEQWFVQADLPGVAITPASTGRAVELLALEQFGPRTPKGISNSSWTDRTSDVEFTNPVRIVDLRAAMNWHRLESTANVWGRRSLVWPAEERLTVGDPARGDGICSADVQYSLENGSLVERTLLHVRLPRLELEAGRILDKVEGGALTPDVIERAAASDEALISLLLRLARDRAAAARAGERSVVASYSDADASVQTAIDGIISRRYGITSGRLDVAVAKRALSELEGRRRFNPKSAWSDQDRPVDVEFHYAPLRALALAAPEALLSAEIRNRNEFAAIAAGMQRQPALFEDCRRLFIVSIDRDGIGARDEGQRAQATAAAWAMLSMDPERSGDVILDAVLRDPIFFDSEMWRLLAYSGSARVCARLEAIWGPSVHENPFFHTTASRESSIAVTGIDAGWRIDDYWLGR